jgi:hypothetical protein
MPEAPGTTKTVAIHIPIGAITASRDMPLNKINLAPFPHRRKSRL